MIDILFYGMCLLVSRDLVLNDLQYQYESTEPGEDGQRYDIYSDDDGNYVCVKEE